LRIRVPGSWLGRLAALLLIVATSPVLLVAWLRHVGTGRPFFTRRSAMAVGRADEPHLTSDVFAYRELNSFSGWLRRWPQLWNVVRGDLAWVGNPPVTREEAAELKTEFERLWLAVPPGLVSLADARGCPERMGDEARAHATFYAASRNRRLDASILAAVIRRLVWPAASPNLPSNPPVT